jgi:hypothetical protein
MLDEDKPLISTPFSHEECNNIDIANPRIGFIIISTLKKQNHVSCVPKTMERKHTSAQQDWILKFFEHLYCGLVSDAIDMLRSATGALRQLGGFFLAMDEKCGTLVKMNDI